MYHLAADVAAGAAVHDHLQAVIAAQDAAPQVAGRRGDADFALQDARRVLVLGPDEDDGLLGPDRPRGDGDALDEHVGVGVDQHPVLEGAGLHLVGVAHQIAREGRIRGDGHHLAAGREGRAAPAQERRIQHDLLNLLAGSPCHDLRERLVAAAGAVLLQRGDAVRPAVFK
ncbi:MAG: hypothetical protein MUC33_03395 [Desulfobacterales bacterium]|nr:hypothetical protein [Desulfobacterales bacterium]